MIMNNTQLEPFLSHRTYELMTKYTLKQSEKQIKDVDTPHHQILMTFQNGDEKHHAGCVYNFGLYLPILKYNTSVTIPNEESELAKCIIETWPANNYTDSFEQLYNDMNKKALALDTPGWIFLTYNTKRKKLHVCSLQLHDNPLCYCNDGPLRIPLFAWNLWEHAYYLQYEYRKHNYIKALWYITNWDVVEARFKYIVEKEQPLVLKELLQNQHT